MPWKLYADPHGYIFTWLIGSSSLLGAVGGVLIADYWVLRRATLDVPGLYQAVGPYTYRGGFNPAALIALVLAVAPCLPGFVRQVSGHAAAGLWDHLYTYAWFVSFAVGFAVYLLLMAAGVSGAKAATNVTNGHE
jgi:NCS1 family nucleobase:cation symporter-1